MTQRKVGPAFSPRTVTVIGGIRGLEPEYTRILKDNNLIPRIYNRDTTALVEKVEQTDFIILFIATVSHRMAKKVRKAASGHAIPLVAVKPSSLSALKKSMGAILPSAPSPHRR